MKLNNELGYDEVVDTLADSVELGEKLGVAFSDGVQWQDSFLIIGESQRIEEIARDAPVAYRQFLDLTPEEATKAEAELAERLSTNPSEIKGKIKGAINLLTRTYVLFDDYVEYFKSFRKEAA